MTWFAFAYTTLGWGQEPEFVRNVVEQVEGKRQQWLQMIAEDCIGKYGTAASREQLDS